MIKAKFDQMKMERIMFDLCIFYSNFIQCQYSVERFAEHNLISVEDCNILLEMSKKYRDKEYNRIDKIGAEQKEIYRTFKENISDLSDINTKP